MKIKKRQDAPKGTPRAKVDKNVVLYALLNGSRKSPGRQKCGSHSLCSVLGGLESGPVQMCIQYNVFDQFEGAQERNMDCEIVDRTLIEMKWQVRTKITQKCNTLCKMGAGSESVKTV